MIIIIEYNKLLEYFCVLKCSEEITGTMCLFVGQWDGWNSGKNDVNL